MNKETIFDIKENVIPSLIKDLCLKDLVEIGGYQNYICKCRLNRQILITRITSSKHRTYNEIENELLFLNALLESDISVIKPIAVNEKSIYSLKTEKQLYFISFFRFYEGKACNEISDPSKYINIIPETLAKIHIASQKINSQIKRDTWDQNKYLTNASNILPKDKIWLLEKYSTFKEELNRVDKTSNNFGLIHGDFQGFNIIHQENNIVIIDFDELEHNWYLYDIAVYFFYQFLGPNPIELEKYLSSNIDLLKHFIDRYSKVLSIDKKMLRKMDMFFRLREYTLLFSLYKSYKFENMHEWGQNYINVTEQKIINNEAFIPLDF